MIERNLLNNEISITPRGDEPSVCTILSEKGIPLAQFQFQHGTLAGVEDTNGVMVEDLIGIAFARIDALNEPPYDCLENEVALVNLKAALIALAGRTADRRARGVEGTAQV